ncbi:hypothetical protein [Tenuifilum thalassicum]|uniref:Uncharacterized protein n=1 Tax=Tenuifilum thalassicum TaxID=2590900 RepID=A0A7D4BJE9_9BACT|nr:hypothetical protein [Tenuifilum thalassicum]QKG79519.1 hypothetical protein FHG85_04295 [Tenuifilum thalassicum]
MLTKEELLKRLERYRQGINFEGNDKKFYEFISINFSIDSFFLTNLLSMEEFSEFIENPQKREELNMTLGEIIEEKISG